MLLTGNVLAGMLEEIKFGVGVLSYAPSAVLTCVNSPKALKNRTDH
jgi:hypothetical protein